MQYYTIEIKKRTLINPEFVDAEVLKSYYIIEITTSYFKNKILTFLFMDQLEKIASWIMKRKIVEDYLPYQVINN